MSLNKRKHLRIELNDLSIDISDGFGSCSAGAVDISRSGMSLVNLSKRLGRDSDNYTVVASTRDGRVFKFNVRPKWEETGLSSKSVGVEIVNAPSKWTEYVKSLEPGASEDKDVWSGASDK